MGIGVLPGHNCAKFDHNCPSVSDSLLAKNCLGGSRLWSPRSPYSRFRSSWLRASFAEHRGRIVKTTGDGVLIEFPSVVDAVRCAVEIQLGMAERAAVAPTDRRIDDLRMGINIVDIIIDNDDIYGDGVNVAARLDALAEPGSICVSRVVRDQMRDKARRCVPCADVTLVATTPWAEPIHGKVSNSLNVRALRGAAHRKKRRKQR
jgi:hypothetical protein